MPTMTDIAKPDIGIVANNPAAMLTIYGDGPGQPVRAVMDMPGGGVPQ